MQREYSTPKVHMFFSLDTTMGVCMNGEAAPQPACSAGQSAGGPGGCSQGNVADDRCVAGTSAGSVCKAGVGF